MMGQMLAPNLDQCAGCRIVRVSFGRVPGFDLTDAPERHAEDDALGSLIFASNKTANQE